MVVRRTDLLTVLEACELHHKASLLPPAERLIRQLVEDVYRNSVSHVWFWVVLVQFLLVWDYWSHQLFAWFLELDTVSMSLQVDHVSMAENGSQLTGRSQIVRDRLHSKKLIPFLMYNWDKIKIHWLFFFYLLLLTYLFFCLLLWEKISSPKGVSYRLFYSFWFHDGAPKFSTEYTIVLTTNGGWLM